MSQLQARTPAPHPRPAPSCPDAARSHTPPARPRSQLLNSTIQSIALSVNKVLSGGGLEGLPNRLASFSWLL